MVFVKANGKTERRDKAVGRQGKQTPHSSKTKIKRISISSGVCAFIWLRVNGIAEIAEITKLRR